MAAQDAGLCVIVAPLQARTTTWSSTATPTKCPLTRNEQQHHIPCSPLFSHSTVILKINRPKSINNNLSPSTCMYAVPAESHVGHGSLANNNDNKRVTSYLCTRTFPQGCLQAGMRSPGVKNEHLTITRPSTRYPMTVLPHDSARELGHLQSVAFLSTRELPCMVPVTAVDGKNYNRRS